jgi:ABC-type sulfate transport system permease subunit
MDPLAVVEGELGSVDTWPSSLLTDMFCKEPIVSRKVASFLHGNGINAKDAAKLYWACQAAWRNV